MKTLKNVLPRAAVIFLIFAFVCGIVYTLLITGLAQLIFPDKANGSIIEVDGKKYGSELLGQYYNDEDHMWGRIMISPPIRTKTEKPSCMPLRPTCHLPAKSMSSLWPRGLR